MLPIYHSNKTLINQSCDAQIFSTKSKVWMISDVRRLLIFDKGWPKKLFD